MKRITFIAALCVSLSACTPAGGLIHTPVAERVAVAAVTALSLGELAYNSAEATATAAIRSGHLSQSQVADLGRRVHAARDYRNQARALVAAGGDATVTLDLLAQSLTNIRSLTGD